MIYIFRHAQSEANKKLLYGTDMPLSENGINQALRTKEQLTIKPALAISSKMKRAVQTRDIIFPNAEHGESDIFNEICFGELEGKEITAENGSEISGNPKLVKTKYQGDDIWERAELAIRYIRFLSRHTSGDIAIILHDTIYQAIGWKLAGKQETPYGIWGNGEEYLYWFEKDWSKQTYHLDNCEYIDWETLK